MLEKVVKAAVRKRLNELGCYQFWFVPFGLGDTTVDCLGCHNSQFFAIECKRPGLKPTLRQAMILNKIKAAGGLVFVIDSVEQAQKLFA